MKLRQKLARLARAVGWRRRISVPWVTAEENPGTPRPIERFRFFAIVGTWFEEDIIEATVRNAFCQGCERVFIVDNDSPDNTVALAVAAGAELAREFTTDEYDEVSRLSLMNEVVRDVSDRQEASHTWWLWLDADEFPHGPFGLTIREYLEGLDERFRVVGARNLNHFPDRKPYYVSGHHPLDFQPLAEEFVAAEFGHCSLGHWKHPVLRYDKTGPGITCGVGFHRAKCVAAPLLEPVVPIFLHHFPYRERAFTERRFRTLCEPQDARAGSRNKAHDLRVGGVSGISKRLRSLEAVYAGRWESVENLHNLGNPVGVHPRPWLDIVGPDHVNWRSWPAPAGTTTGAPDEYTKARTQDDKGSTRL